MDFQSAMDTFVEAWMAANTKTDQVQVFINCYCYYYYYYFAARLSPSRIVRLKSLLRNRGINRLTARWLKSNPLPSPTLHSQLATLPISSALLLATSTCHSVVPLKPSPNFISIRTATFVKADYLQN